ncbi:heavy metal translocating P-type ATPase [Atopobacter phocae]|uniref:heavy metal translocating P-type ATPase n=1 Tax=Atopobacter phocae TaxID=136492 RepID=UPI000471C2D7|nr:heavy metal translocating P-type ATPase [Atopobacter phocae]
MDEKKLALTTTVISGILIVIGFLIPTSTIQTIIFLLAFVIGGYLQAVEGIQDSLENKRLNVDILMVVAALGAALIGYWFEGALLIFIFAVSGTLEAYATDKSKKTMEALLEQQPTTARIQLSDGSTKEIGIDELKIGDRLLLRKGDVIPIDGFALEPIQVNEASLTGESVPVDKEINDELFGGTINVGASGTMEVTKLAEDMVFSKIIQLVKDAQENQTQTETFIKKIENKYAYAVLIGVPIAILIFHFFMGWTWNESLYRGMVLLTVASPCALIASSTPVILSAISNSSKHGILTKNGAMLETLYHVKAIAFDKTGTLTSGELTVDQVHFADHLSQTEQTNLKQIIKSIEEHSSHPIAKAITKEFESMDRLELDDITEVNAHGLMGQINGKTFKVGKRSFVSDSLSSQFEKIAQQELHQGKTIIYIGQDQTCVAMISLMDHVKPEAKAVIKRLKELHITPVLLTGDHDLTAQAIANELGIDDVHANCLPEDKTNLIKELQATYGSVAMVGDGINDAPALSTADLSFAMGTGTDIAMESADFVIMSDNLQSITYTHELARKVRRVTTQNITFALGMITLLIISNIFQLINLPIGVIGHEGSTILVILNGLRLLQKLPHYRDTTFDINLSNRR